MFILQIRMVENNKKIIMGFWKDLPDRAKLVAPMADVTDVVFREIIAKYSKMGEKGGGPDVLYTEFISADGLYSDEGRNNIMHLLKYNKKNRPIVAQIFSSNPNKIEYAANLCADLGFDGVDLNMGCPEKNITKQGAGSAMIKTPELAKEIIYAAKRGAGDIPISVKTRIGWSSVEVEKWIPILLDTNIAAIILHGRTRKQMSKVPANWDIIDRAGEIVKASGKSTKFFGNGDIINTEQADEYCKKYNVDGVMVGRGLFGNPWFFDSQRISVSTKERLEVMLEHSRLFLKLLPDKNFNIMKKHYKAYVSGFSGAKDLRSNLMNLNSYIEIEKHVNDFIEKNIEIK